MTPFLFICCVLAVWRISRFLRKESGPGNALERMRNHFVGDDPADGSLADFMSCNKCQSVWIALAIMPMVYQTLGSLLVSLSMLCCIGLIGYTASSSPDWCKPRCKINAFISFLGIVATCWLGWELDSLQSLYMPFAVSAPTFALEYMDNAYEWIKEDRDASLEPEEK